MTAAQHVAEGPGLGFGIARNTALLPGLAALVNDMQWNSVTWRHALKKVGFRPLTKIGKGCVWHMTLEQFSDRMSYTKSKKE